MIIEIMPIEIFEGAAIIITLIWTIFQEIRHQRKWDLLHKKKIIDKNEIAAGVYKGS
jgi:hypothetical protein